MYYAKQMTIIEYLLIINRYISCQAIYYYNLYYYICNSNQLADVRRLSIKNKNVCFEINNFPLQ